jgi:hypothetical protein
MNKITVESGWVLGRFQPAGLQPAVSWSGRVLGRILQLPAFTTCDTIMPSGHPTVPSLLKKYNIRVNEAVKRSLPVTKWAEHTYTYCTFGSGSQFSPEAFFRLHRAAHNFLRSGSRTLLGNLKNLQLELAEVLLHNTTLHDFGISNCLLTVYRLRLMFSCL